MKQENKRAAIVSFKFYPQSDVTVENFPGVPVIQVMGFCLQFKATAAEFKETIVAGEGVNQQFSAVVTDLSADNLTYNRAILAQPGVIQLIYSNGLIRVVGTGEFPVLLTIEESGRPAGFKLSFKRLSPEPAKILQSF